MTRIPGKALRISIALLLEGEKTLGTVGEIMLEADALRHLSFSLGAPEKRVYSGEPIVPSPLKAKIAAKLAHDFIFSMLPRYTLKS